MFLVDYPEITPDLFILCCPRRVRRICGSFRPFPDTPDTGVGAVDIELPATRYFVTVFTIWQRKICGLTRKGVAIQFLGSDLVQSTFGTERTQPLRKVEAKLRSTSSWESRRKASKAARSRARMSGSGREKATTARERDSWKAPLFPAAVSVATAAGGIYGERHVPWNVPIYGPWLQQVLSCCCCVPLVLSFESIR